ncbi:hypothetical protein [Lactobacillus taiwanensis]|uniref:hypothetical protein n=1 Tax=Lactobacillus taiwanensis TaxID=508451 RepID=UPI00214BA5E8|nr:hypothetical protein [Lactobacillus taiwanensis]MCR1904175.1 hypothetical protein [Lactobacillus taiwanensis]
MDNLTKEKLQEYKKGPLYELFHAYHPIENDNDRLYITPKKKPVKKEISPINENINQQPLPPMPRTVNDELSVTNQVPQNDTFAMKNAQETRLTQSTQPTQKISNEPIKESSNNTNSVSVSIPKPQIQNQTQSNSVSISIPHPEPVKTVKNTNQVNTVTNQTEREVQPTPTNTQRVESSEQYEQYTTAETKQEPNQSDSYLKNPARTNNTIDAAKPIQNEESINSVENSLPTPNQDTNLLNSIVTQEKSAANSEQQAKEAVYKEIMSSADDIKWIEKSHKLELAFKQDLAKIPLKKITVYSTKDDSEFYIPLNSVLFNMLGSVVIGKSLYLLLIFRNGKTITIAPYDWMKSDKNAVIQQGFQYYYTDLDLSSLKTTLQIMSGSITPTDKYTEFWLKYMPAITD